MKLSHSRAEVEARLTDALVRLGSARREKLSKEDFDVYADGLRAFPIDVVQRVCLELGHQAPAEFQPRFPPLYVIREACIKAVEAARTRRLMLSAPRQEPADPERLEQLKRDIAAELRRKSMR
jgi:hypothetical protein